MSSRGGIFSALEAAFKSSGSRRRGRRVGIRVRHRRCFPSSCAAHDILSLVIKHQSRIGFRILYQKIPMACARMARHVMIGDTDAVAAINDVKTCDCSTAAILPGAHSRCRGATAPPRRHCRRHRRHTLRRLSPVCENIDTIHFQALSSR